MPSRTQKAAPVPPQSIEAEMSALGAMLLEESAAGKVRQIVSAADFYRLPHQTLFTVIEEMYAGGAPVDLVTLQEALRSRGALDEVGGVSYLLALWETLPSAANAEYYAQIVADRSEQRRLWELGHRLIAATGGEVKDVGQLAQRLRDDLDRAAPRSGGTGGRRKTIAARCIDLADVPEPGEDEPGLTGPYVRPSLIHWATGQTGAGKTTVGFNIACALAEGRSSLWGVDCRPCAVLYVDLESGDRTRARKLYSLYHGAPRVRGKLHFMREPIRLPDELPDLLAFVKAHGVELVIFDTARRTFQVEEENSSSEFYNRILPTLDALKLAGVASLVLGHPGKNGDGSARGTGAQEDAPDVILRLTIHKGEKEDPDAVIKLAVSKHRELGLGIPPLYLRRVGGDQFERVDEREATAAPDEGAPRLKRQQCADFLLGALGAGSLSHTEMDEAAKAAGFKSYTFNEAFRSLRDAGQIAKGARGVWMIRDPFEGDLEGDSPALVLTKVPNRSTELD